MLLLGCEGRSIVGPPPALDGAMEVRFEGATVEAFPRSAGLMEVASADGACRPSLLLWAANGVLLDLPVQGRSWEAPVPFDLDGLRDVAPALVLEGQGADGQGHLAFHGGEGEASLDVGGGRVDVTWLGAEVEPAGAARRAVEGPVVLAYTLGEVEVVGCLEADTEVEGWCAVGVGSYDADVCAPD